MKNNMWNQLCETPWKHPPIFIRCQKCNHVFSHDEIVNDNICKLCNTGFCYNCGSSDLRGPSYSWDEWGATCENCGEIL